MINRKIMFACDLDNTLIYSFKHKQEGDLCVEYLNGNEQSFMSKKAYDMLQGIYENTVFLPVTTRSIEQYKRISLLKAASPRYAITTNGGILLEDDCPDLAWHKEFLELSRSCSEQLKLALELFGKVPEVTKYRMVDELYAFAVSENAKTTTELLLTSLDTNSMAVDMQGRKVYAIPRGINKAAGIIKLQREEKYYLICAGDSELDIPMLDIADLAIVPNEALAMRLRHSNVKVWERSVSFAEFVLGTVERKVKALLY